ncbi:MAG: DNA polymerase III subunit alpha [Prevotella sp.]|jgi:hypothetical protein|nr:DNA polymerase III subunit alpha [Prevotella sp.]
MRIKSLKACSSPIPLNVVDCKVDNGYRQGTGRQLADVDIDFQSDRRQEIKEYLERRYNMNGKQRVFSAGTFSTLKLKAVLKDVSRVHRIPINIVNYITAIFDDDNMGWTELFKLAATNKKVRRFILDYPQVIEEIRTLIGQPRSASIHASAIIVTPDNKDGQPAECFDFLPIKKIDGTLVSELDGYSIDEIGLLKNDCLGIKELTKLHSIINLCNDNYKDGISFEQIVRGSMDDEKTYRLISNGYSQSIFQFSSRGMTRFLVDMQPETINDLIAANALFRPATLESGSAEKYLIHKRGDVAPVYLWGTFDALKDTYGTLCIAEDAKIITNDGLKKIQDVRYADLVLTEDGSFQQVVSSMCVGVKDTIRVRTTHGMELICTPGHKLLTQRGWIEAGKIIPGQHLIKGFWMADEQTEAGTMKDWCLGYYLANGSYSTTTSIACRNKEEAEKVSEIFNGCFNLDSRIYFHTRCWYVALSASRKGGRYKQNAFTEYLKYYGLDDCRSYDKYIPTKPNLMLITGIIEGDGCTKNGLMRLVNPLLAKQVFYGLQSYRIPSSYYEKVENGQIINVVAFNDNSTRKLKFVFKQHNTGDTKKSRGSLVPSRYLSTVNTTSLTKGQKFNTKKRQEKDGACFMETVLKYGGAIEHDVWGAVLNVQRDEKTRVYDISVEVNHSFCANGLVVHNCYQEQLARISREVGGFSLAEGIRLLKLISKKRTADIHAMKEKFMDGAAQKGCPEEDAVKIWEMIEAGGAYIFNKSHATAYAITSYCGAWLKVNYPTAFYTVALQWADDKEIPLLMSEMELCSEAKIVAPDINVSDIAFYTDYTSNEIFWSLTRIKMLGPKAVNFIIEERQKHGNFTSIENFIHRIFKYKLKKYQYWDDPDNEDGATRIPVNSLHVRHLILSGCFDRAEKIRSINERFHIMEKAAIELGLTENANDFYRQFYDVDHFWSIQQINIAGIGSIYYRCIYDNSLAKDKIRGKASYMSLRDALIFENEGKRIAVCATVVEVDEMSYKNKSTGEKKQFCKLKLQQNNDLIELVCWNDFYLEKKEILSGLKNKVIIITTIIKYSDYTGANSLNTYKSSILHEV